MQIYEEGRLPFYHFDVYRIGDVEEMDEIGYEDYIYGEGVSPVSYTHLRPCLGGILRFVPDVSWQLWTLPVKL